MAKNIRSEYLQQLIEDKNNLNSKLKEVAQSTVASIMGENIENKLRKIISEDEDSFIEDEVEDDSIESSKDTSDEVTDTEEETLSDEDGDTEVEVEKDTEITDDGMEDDETVEDSEEDIWNDLEQFKGADGEYDLTGMDADNLIKVMQKMSPADGVRVIKNDDGTLTLSDDNTEKEYIIDIEDDTEDSVFEEGVEESGQMECNEDANLGYTDNFQNKTAMTTPPNTEPANSKSTYSMDGGVSTGTEKRWANQGDKAPYDENVNEETEFEIDIEDDEECKGKKCCDEEEQLDETMTTQEQGPYNRGTGMVHTNTNSKAAKGRNARAGGQQVSGTGDNSYSNSKLESIMRKANAIFNENKELKALVPKMQQQIMESIVINKSMGNVMKIVMENSTSINEKKEILSRFTNVKTIEESDKLYQTISEELKREGKQMNVDKVINSQLAESKNSVVETPMYQSEDLSRTLNLMNRMNLIK